MSDTVIKVESLGKSYMIRHAGGLGRYTALRDVLANKAKQMAGVVVRPFAPRQQTGLQQKREEFWALRDISIEIKQGERIGIIGRNGAGKSTLLKILSRITAPTKGSIDIYGRVGSLLEVGTGFHPELTGRENIYLNGAILGMHRAEIKKKFDEIVAFAEVEKFLDTPVKRYSSGMYVRLAFAVAAHLEPEILIVDEVLAVGDAQFQKKCLGKMGEVSKNGRTVLFVSHNMTAVKSLCGKAILLEAGQISCQGNVQDVINKYVYSQKFIYEKVWKDIDKAPGNDKIRFKKVAVYPINEDGVIRTSEPIKFEFEIYNFLHSALLNYTVHCYTLEGVEVFNSISSGEVCNPGDIKGTMDIPADFFNSISYTITVKVVIDRSTPICIMENALLFDVNEGSARKEGWMGKWTGVVRPNFQWNIQRG